MGNVKIATDEHAGGNLVDARCFIETFLWIVNKQRENVPFKFNLIQNSYYKERSRNDLILKARKPGISALVSAIWLHACIHFDNVRAVVVSHEDDATRRLFERVHRYLDTMGTKDERFDVELNQESQTQISFPERNSSFWIGTAGSRTFGRGDDITHLHLSEVSHYKNQEILVGVMEACVPNAYKVMETTANGVGEMFHRLWQESKDKQSYSVWKRHFFAWFDDPGNNISIPSDVTFRPTEVERQLKTKYHLTNEQVYWWRNKLGEIPDRTLMPQEYPSNEREAFVSTGRHIINLEKLEVMAARIEKPKWVGDLDDDGRTINFNADEHGYLKIWKMPRERSQYLISADVAEGVPGGAWSVAPVLDRSTWEQVAVWRGRIDPGKFGRVMCDIGYFYNDALLIPENNNHGWATIERIKLDDYPHLFNTQMIWPEEEGKKSKEGFPTNERSKELCISTVRNCVDDFTCYINDQTTINELNTLIRNEKGQAVAQKGCWMDCVSSLSIGLYALKFLTVEENYAPRARVSGRGESLTTSFVGTSKRRTGYG